MIRVWGIDINLDPVGAQKHINWVQAGYSLMTLLVDKSLFFASVSEERGFLFTNK